MSSGEVVVPVLALVAMGGPSGISTATVTWKRTTSHAPSHNRVCPQFIGMMTVAI